MSWGGESFYSPRMTDDVLRYLDIFPQWLERLGEDSEALAVLVADEQTSTDAKRPLVGGLNALLKSVDLIPDGLQDLGYVDDAFMLRVCCRLALEAQPELASSEACQRLATDTQSIESFVGDEIYPRFVEYVQALTDVAVRGRSVADVLDEPELLAELTAEVRAFAKQYESVGFGRDEKNLIRLRGFLDEATKSRSAG